MNHVSSVLASAALAALLHVTPAQTLAGDQGNHGDHDSDGNRWTSAHDEAEIARLTTTYAWAVDAKDIDQMMSIFSRNAVYDLSAYGFPNVVGYENIRNMFIYGVFPSEKCSFSSISNVKVSVKGNRAEGGDYFMHFGYDGKNGPLTRHHVEGQHFYKFVKEKGQWKISWMQGHPTFEKVETYDPTLMRHCP